ncbi:hypothetical protein HN031_01950 [Nocardioides sp. zg-1308]|uniref:Uncharacterized protein n=1 Tax=Nocardioides renjunii TaxID=3095075 RepID=A0ABU5K6W1_9ACTN|nr:MULTISPECIES: hypothetical protein [unclassified Nocardioides]MDZ5660335.1 hypothetical protein [Nocardioides sp. S-58]NPD03445.1 hypothetical protein [Nocardioides sp. zg-1308]WQQ21340.1 hypothetical protein SHK17_15745 [Nocardioides sp. S-34]
MPVPVLPLRALWHMGALHPYEQALTILLAFGPFVLLGVVVWLRRRADAALPEEDPRPADSSSPTARHD